MQAGNHIFQALIPTLLNVMKIQMMTKE